MIGHSHDLIYGYKSIPDNIRDRQFEIHSALIRVQNPQISLCGMGSIIGGP